MSAVQRTIGRPGAWRALAAAVLALAGCGAAGEGAQGREDAAGEGATREEVCRVEEEGVALPAALRETSGVAASRRGAGLLWTHNDSGNGPFIHAVRVDGEVVGQVEVEGAENVDWEDVAAGPCPGGGDCLYVADTGDNEARRDEVAIWRVPEPAPGASVTAHPVRLAAHYPGGPRDAEALFVLPGGEAYVVTKGDDVPVELFRWPAEDGGTMQRVRRLAPAPDQPGDRVTGAGASPDGRWVAVRTYSTLHLWRTEDLLSDGGEPAVAMDLVPLGHSGGEAVALGDDGAVVLTSEGLGKRVPPTLSRLRCTLPD